MPVRQESLFSYSQLGRKTGNKLKLQPITLAKQKKTAQVRLPHSVKYSVHTAYLLLAAQSGQTVCS